MNFFLIFNLLNYKFLNNFKPLSRFINVMASSLLDFLFYDSNPEIIRLLLEIIKMDVSHVLRERITRDNNI